MNEDLINDIIVKTLKAEATPHEKRMLANWLNEDPAREEVFYYHLSRLESNNPQYLPEVESKLDTYERYLRGEIARPQLSYCSHEKNAGKPTRWWNSRLSWAASLVFILSACLYFVFGSLSYETYHTGKGGIREVVLEEGTKVTLNANSCIKVPRDFVAHASREVWIQGEAFFEVTRTTDMKKFIVHTDNFDVEVLGTKFNISNKRHKSEVILTEGKIKLITKDLEPLIMNPGELVSRSNTQIQFRKEAVKPAMYEAWRHSLLVFENTPLADVTEIIEDHYDVKLIVTDSLLQRREFTGTLPNNDLEVILLALSVSYQIDVKRRGDLIFLTPNKNTIVK